MTGKKNNSEKTKNAYRLYGAENPEKTKKLRAQKKL